jgi:hypothetical protein
VWLAADTETARCAGMTDQQHATITSVLHRAPDWIRHDLLAKEPVVRQRAEKALAAMIAAAQIANRSVVARRCR